MTRCRCSTSWTSYRGQDVQEAPPKSESVSSCAKVSEADRFLLCATFTSKLSEVYTGRQLYCGTVIKEAVLFSISRIVCLCPAGGVKVLQRGPGARSYGFRFFSEGRQWIQHGTVCTRADGRGASPAQQQDTGIRVLVLFKYTYRCKMQNPVHHFRFRFRLRCLSLVQLFHNRSLSRETEFLFLLWKRCRTSYWFFSYLF